MKISFATLGCPEWNLEQIAGRASEMGFDGVELRGAAGEHIGPEESPEERERIRTLFMKAGVEICCIMGYSNFTSPKEDERRENIALAAKYLDTARDIGCPTLRVFGGMLSGQKREVALPSVIEALKEVCRKAEECGVRLALETHDDWRRGENLAAVLDGVGSPMLGVCWDIGNSYFVEPLAETHAAISGRIYHVHFKDGAREEENVVSKLPGEGEVDLKNGLQLLRSGGYDGYLSFEWEKKWEPALEEPEVAFPRYARFTTDLLNEEGVPHG